MAKIIVNAQTSLRPLRWEDAPLLYALTVANRHHLRRWLPWVDDVRDVKDTENFIEAAIAQHNQNQGVHVGIWHRGELAGVLGVHRIDWRNRSTVIGYWMGERFQGKGLMTSSVRVYLDRLVFGEWGLNRAEIAAATENWRSRAIPERLGFVLEGILRERENLYGRFVDHAVYGMLAEDWKKQKNPN